MVNIRNIRELRGNGVKVRRFERNQNRRNIDHRQEMQIHQVDCHQLKLLSQNDNHQKDCINFKRKCEKFNWKSR